MPYDDWNTGGILTIPNYSCTINTTYIYIKTLLSNDLSGIDPRAGPVQGDRIEYAYIVKLYTIKFFQTKFVLF